MRTSKVLIPDRALARVNLKNGNDEGRSARLRALPGAQAVGLAGALPVAAGTFKDRH